MRLLRKVTTMLLLVVVITACGENEYRTYGFERVRSSTATGQRFELVVLGKSARVDSAGVVSDRTGSPYWVGLYITDTDPESIESIRLRMTGTETGSKFSPMMSPPALMEDSVTLFSGATNIPLSFEDHRVVIDIERRTEAGVSSDTAHLMLRKTYEEHRVSFWEWLTRH